MKNGNGYTDTDRLDFLEKDIEDDALLLFHETPRNGNKGFRGLGLKSTGRTLRQALDQLMSAHGIKPRSISPKG